MLKFTSVSASDLGITEDITLTGIIIRTGITLDLTIGRITGRTTGTERIVIMAIIIVIPIVTDTNLDRDSHNGRLETFRAP